MDHTDTQNLAEMTIKPRVSFTFINYREIWAHRELLKNLILRDLKVIYSGTILGKLWVGVQPLLTASILSIFLGYLARIPSGGIPYPVMILSGLVIWTFVSSSINRSAQSIVTNSAMLNKVYFPRGLLPIAVVIAGMLDFVVYGIVLLVFAMIFGISPSITWLGFAAPIIVVIIFCFGASFWMAIIALQKDVRASLPVVLQLFFYASPIIYPMEIVPAKWHWLYTLNPVVGLIEATRWALTASGPFPLYSFSISTMTGLILLITGLYLFSLVESTMADLI